MKLSEIFNELLEARVTINDTTNLAIIFIKEDNIFLLIDTTTSQPKGYISFGLTQGDVYGIYGAYSDRGYGALLYELAMTYVYPKGITMSDDSSTSQDAMNVWEKFITRDDVEKKPIVRKQRTDKEEWFDDMSQDFDDEENKKWIARGRELHNTQFIYTLGMDNLNKLIAKGDEYLKQNPKTNVMDMVYSLER
tara:strand:- start:389 stop:967 length:579 start_codon:yes stop_codon:yes gene_type:complete